MVEHHSRRVRQPRPQAAALVTAVREVAALVGGCNGREVNVHDAELVVGKVRAEEVRLFPLVLAVKPCFAFEQLLQMDREDRDRPLRVGRGMFPTPIVHLHTQLVALVTVIHRSRVKEQVGPVFVQLDPRLAPSAAAHDSVLSIASLSAAASLPSSAIRMAAAGEPSLDGEHSGIRGLRLVWQNGHAGQRALRVHPQRDALRELLAERALHVLEALEQPLAGTPVGR